ncbi:MAG: 3'(2'),5'-bisphosphate nucleotidase CysQ, partial [Burkholderiales bacterium]|nr:3'(2'),5'-bisphosphate nucleotidase CysQ [Burkholderiales bacterium]
MTLAPLNLAGLLDGLTPLIRDAGKVIMDIYATDFDVTKKGDDSPVTAADQRAETVILAGLKRLAPEIPVVAEEAVAAGHVPDVGARFWLVDPLDGTKEFISRNGEFTVNIALVENGRPILGLVYAPAIERLFGGAEGLGAWVEDK